MEAPISRVSRSKVQARASYNQLSRWYDWIAGSSEKKYRDLGLEKLNAQPGERVCEIGIGTGHCILALARCVEGDGKVYGLDISDGMLAVTRQRLLADGLLDRAHLFLGDATHLPFLTESFHAVFMSFTLELFDTPEIPRV